MSTHDFNLYLELREMFLSVASDQEKATFLELNKYSMMIEVKKYMIKVLKEKL